MSASLLPTKAHHLDGSPSSDVSVSSVNGRWTLRQVGSAAALLLIILVAGVHSLPEAAGLPSLRKRSPAFAGEHSLVARAAPLPPLSGKQLYVDFTKIKSNSQLPALLSQNGLYVSDYPTDSTPISHSFTPKNVDWSKGAMRLKVTGQTGTGDIQAAEVGTEADNILFGTVTTRARATSVKGVCQGFFFSKDDNTEVDIELLSTYYTKGASKYGVPAGVEFTNQPLKKGQPETNTAVKFPWDPSHGFHDYTVTWTRNSTIFSLDGVVVATLDTNVPQKPTSFLWNNWSSGDPYWSAGPPSKNAYLLISHIAGNWTTSKK